MKLKVDWKLMWRRLWSRKMNECCGGYCGGVMCPGAPWTGALIWEPTGSGKGNR